MVTPGLTLRGACLTRDGQALLTNVDLEFDSGVTAVMGPNGAGKSLTLRVAAGLIPLDSGRVCAAPGAQAAYVAQTPVMLRRSTAANLRFALACYGVPRRLRAAETEMWLDMANLLHRAGAPARALSGGERQRLAIVRALAARPSYLLLDEPTASLDPAATLAVEGLIRRAILDQTARVGLATHDIGQARRLADRVAFLHKGQVIETAAADMFFDQPRSSAAQDYLAGKLVL